METALREMTTLEYKSLPSRERELKQDVGDAVVDVLLSLPSRERELKPDILGIERAVNSRSPRGSMN